MLSTLLSESIRLNARAFSTGEMVRPDFLDHGISAMAGMNGMDTEASAVDHPDPTIIDFVENSGLVPPGKYTRFERLPGGVSSDIWLVHADDRSFCVKRALAQLR